MLLVLNALDNYYYYHSFILNLRCVVNWEAIGAVIELIGAFSVFLTLLYLAKQIKGNSKLLTTSVYQTARDG